MKETFIYPDWPAPAHIKAFTTTRKGGYSKPPFDSFNLATHVDDTQATVLKNRQLLTQSLPSAPIWLNQTHTSKIISLNDINDVQQAEGESYDGSFTTQPNLVCAVLTADCLPILLTDTLGSFVAAIHAGWRGLVTDVIANSLIQVPMNERNDVMAWLGPAIGPQCFEVGDDVRDVFTALSDSHFLAFSEKRKKLDSHIYADSESEGKWFCDIYALARNQLKMLGVSKIYGGQHCTYSENELFYSYRRTADCGRMASCIFMDSAPLSDGQTP